MAASTELVTGERRVVGLAVVTVLALVLRVAYVLVVVPRTDLGADATWYLLQAGIIGSGRGFLDPEAFFASGASVATANFPPLWPAVLAVAEWAGLGGERAYRLAGVAFGTATVPVVGLVGQRVVGGRSGLIAAALVACSPLMVASDGSLMAESLYVLLTALAVLAAYRAIDRRDVLSVAMVGLVGGLAILTRSDGLFVVPLLVVATVLAMDAVPGRRRLGLMAAGLAVAVAVIVPWSVRSSIRLDGTVVVTSNAGSVLEGANCDTTYTGELLGAWDAGCLAETRRGDRSEREWSAAAREKGLEHAWEHRGRIPLVATARVARAFGVWDPAALARLEAEESRHERWQLLGWAYGVVVLVLAVPGTVLLRRRHAELGPLVAVVAGVVVSVLVTWGNQRFRLAAEPAFAVAASAAIVAAWPRVISRRGRRPRGSPRG